MGEKWETRRNLRREMGENWETRWNLRREVGVNGKQDNTRYIIFRGKTQKKQEKKTGNNRGKNRKLQAIQIQDFNEVPGNTEN